MLHGPTEAPLKRQIAGAISYGGGNLSAFKLLLCKGWPGSENKARPQTKECGLRSANRCTCQWPGLLCAARSEGSRPRLRAVQNCTLPACWDLIWKGPWSAGDFTWLFPKPAPASFLGTFLSGSCPNKWIYHPR